MISSRQIPNLVSRQLVAASLRTYREELRFSLDDAAQFLKCDRSKISRIETGDRGIKLAELETLLGEYGADDDALALLGRLADPKGAWRQYADVLPAATISAMALESCATSVIAYEAAQVPVWLQTLDYAQAIAETDPASTDDAIIVAGEVAEFRQQSVLGRDNVLVRLIVGEAALRKRPRAAAMYQQLCKLTQMPKGVHELRIVPLLIDYDPAPWAGSMTLLEFGGIGHLPDVVFLGGPRGPVVLTDEEDVAVCRTVLTRLHGLALTAPDQARLLDQLTSSRQ